jgi:hypothetical protein
MTTVVCLVLDDYSGMPGVGRLQWYAWCWMTTVVCLVLTAMVCLVLDDCPYLSLNPHYTFHGLETFGQYDTFPFYVITTILSHQSDAIIVYHVQVHDINHINQYK